MFRRIVAVLAMVCVGVSCSSNGGTGTTSSAPSSSQRAPGQSQPTATPTQDASKTIWLCKPGTTPNPCLTNESTTNISPDGTRTVTHPKVAPNPKIDCFYVYPTVSTQKSDFANRHIDPEEIAVANAQASRFSQVCNVYAPMYRQRTINGLFAAKTTRVTSDVAYDDVKSAWDDYLAHDNHGRGVILIGHSQGAMVLTRLIASQIETHPAQLKLIVSAMLLGGNVTVPIGKTVGGSFKKLETCTAPKQTGCIIAYSTFLSQPPPNTIFGKGGNGMSVVCTNPAALGGGPAPLDNAFPVGKSLLGGLNGVSERTRWVSYPGRFQGECKSAGDLSWLQVTQLQVAGDTRPELKESLGPTWGLHLYDVNIAMGDLVSVAGSQALAWK